MNDKINITGYLEGSSTEKNPYNIIPSNNITMKGVKNTVLAVKLDKNGKPIGMKFMKPNKDYNFDDAASVLEIPKYQVGIQVPPVVLPSEDPYAYGNDNNILQPNTFAPTGDLANIPPASYGTVEPQQNTANQTTPATGDTNSTLQDVDPLQADIDRLNLEEMEENAKEEEIFANSLQQPQDVSREDIDKMLYDKAVNMGNENANNNDFGEFDPRKRPNIQFFNPYGGLDIPTALTNLGSSIENKDTLGIIANSTKTLFGGARNVLGGMGTARRNNYVMNDFLDSYNDPIEQYTEDGGMIKFKHGGAMKKEKLLTGEYITGIDQDDASKQGFANAEVEAGEYIQSNEGDIAQVIGKKHSQGGEQLPLQEGEKVLTDNLKLGAKNAKYIRDNFDINVKAKDTYARVLDKFGSKIGLKSLVKEEELALAKMEEMEKGGESQTKGLNMQFLNNKIVEIRKQKSPIEEARKMLYGKLFEMQEMDKPEEERAEGFKKGGNFQPGGEQKDYEKYLDYVPEGQSRNEAGAYGSTTEEDIKRAIERNRWWYEPFRDGTFDPTNPDDVKAYQEATGVLQVDGKFGEQTRSYVKDRTVGVPPAEGINMPELTGDLMPNIVTGLPKEGATDVTNVNEEDLTEEEKQARYMVLLPDQYPMTPEGMSPHMKVSRRFDRKTPMKIDPRPYLNEIYAQEEAQAAKLEGLSPNVKAAAMANLNADTQGKITEMMSRIDSTNLASADKTESENVQIQRMEANAAAQDALSYEQRQYLAKAKTDAEIAEYFDKIQAVNIGNYATINALNNANARFSDIQFDGSGYVVSDAPDFEQSLEQLMLAKLMQDNNKTT